MQENIIPFKKQKLFKNANKVSLDTGEVELVDILIEGEKILKTEPAGAIQSTIAEIIDLNGNYVMCPFVNAFCDSKKALEYTYGRQVNDLKVDFLKIKISAEKKNVVEQGAPLDVMLFGFMQLKNILAGTTAVGFNDMNVSNIKLFEGKIDFKCIENIDKYSETELDLIVEDACKSNKKLYLKVGQSLDELGAIDKIYRKPLSQVLEDFGFLDRKPTIVGGNCLEKDELQLLKDYDCKFVICPSEDGKFGRRFTNIKTLQYLDFSIGIGSGYSFEIDFFAYMRQILMNMRSMFEDKNILSEKDVLKMATKNSAIKEGKEANFIVIKKEVSLYDDIFKTLVWEKSKKDVVMTVGLGEILQKNGEILMKNLKEYDIIKMLIREMTIKKDSF